jgi:hypothetical protein
VTPLVRSWAESTTGSSIPTVIGVAGNFGPRPKDAPDGTTRKEVLASLFAEADGRRVYGVDRRGHGGVISPGEKKTDGWQVPVGDLLWAEIEGLPNSRVRLPPGVSAAGGDGSGLELATLV